MPELSIQITGDAAQFNSTLAKTKAEAQRFNSEISRIGGGYGGGGYGTGLDSRNKKLFEGLGKTSGKLGALSGTPGLGEAGESAAKIGWAVYSIEGAAAAFGASMAVATGAIVVFAAGSYAVSKLFSEQKAAIAAMIQEGKDSARAYSKNRAVIEEYDRVILENQAALGAERTKELRVGIRSNDLGTRNATMAEVRSMFGGTGINPELRRELTKSLIEAMPKGKERDLAELKFKFDSELKALEAKVGANRSQETEKLYQDITAAKRAEYDASVEEIAKRYNKPEHQAKVVLQSFDSMAKVGGFSYGALNNTPAIDLQRQMLDVQKQIAINTKTQGIQFK